MLVTDFSQESCDFPGFQRLLVSGHLCLSHTSVPLNVAHRLAMNLGQSLHTSEPQFRICEMGMIISPHESTVGLPAAICENTFDFNRHFHEVSLSQQNPTRMGQPYHLSTLTNTFEKILVPLGTALSNACVASSRVRSGATGKLVCGVSWKTG